MVTMLTDQPGVQFYTGNGLDGSPGKGGVCYPKYGAFCLEAQNYPDAINQVSWLITVNNMLNFYIMTDWEGCMGSGIWSEHKEHSNT